MGETITHIYKKFYKEKIKMKKILSVALAVVMLFAVVALAGCTKDTPKDDTPAATLKFGMGVVANYGKTTNADGDKNGAGEVNTTAVAVLLDADGKIVAIDLDTAQIKPSWTSEGKVVAVEDLRTKYEKGDDYKMAAFGKKHDGSEGKPLEWNAQADEFMKAAVGKTLAEVKAFMADDGYAQGDLAAAGCTIHITDFVAGLEKAVANAADSAATADCKLNVALVAANSHSSKDATADADGVAQIDTTAVAAVVDAAGKVVVAKTDCTQGKVTFDAKGAATLAADAKIVTKLELGDDYNMAKFGKKHDGSEGQPLEWYAQADAFNKALVGKTAAEFAALAGADSYATGDLAAAGCTMAVGDMIKAATAAATVA